ncbi:AraC family transcriptional regulator [Kitasatospora sp. YST-16]|uniref:AraC family transcriptional regulator n=1 Tax=Kitasatospora sp. YST-16 TaxID=2998080 RepID=UPI002B2E8FB2|nr:AraC family transcriptional regulator [Streptomyces sp. Li-HN-5-13]
MPVLFRASFLDPATVAARPDRRAWRLPLLPAPSPAPASRPPATGHGAKTFIDERLVLEAKRLLLHSSSTAAAIGDRLGSPSTTVFTRFFRHRTGETPAAFRARARLTAGAADG